MKDQPPVRISPEVQLLSECRDLLTGLLEWQQWMGGWDAKVWRQAKQLQRKLARANFAQEKRA